MTKAIREAVTRQPRITRLDTPRDIIAVLAFNLVGDGLHDARPVVYLMVYPRVVV